MLAVHRWWLPAPNELLKGLFQFVRKHTLVDRVRLLSADHCAAPLDGRMRKSLTVCGPKITGTPPPLRATAFASGRASLTTG